MPYTGLTMNRRQNLCGRWGQILIILMFGISVMGWRDVSSIDRVRDTKFWAFAVRAPQTIQFYGQKVTAELVLGCVRETYDGGPLQLGSYVWLSQPVAVLAKGQFRFDQGKVEEFRNEGGRNGDHISISFRYTPSELARLVSSTSRFRIQVELVTGLAFFEFDIKKAGDVIAKLPCNPSH
jgi:hypothetical protein